MSSNDRILAALRSADWWTQLDCAQAWQQAAELLEAIDPGAARLAWRHAAESYQVYYDEHRAHLPASRWDHDFGPELSAADARWRALPNVAPSTTLPEWVQHALSDDWSRALHALQQAPEAGYQRAIARVALTACQRAGLRADRQRLAAWLED